MDRPDNNFLHEWHRAINKYLFDEAMNCYNKDGFMYQAKQIADEIPRMSLIFGMERRGELPILHKQCSQSDTEEVVDNHLTCCKGVECRKCEALLALENSELSSEEIDLTKAWTCAVHILEAEGSVDTTEGFILTVDDKMYWSNVYSSLAGQDNQ